nr:predicted protein [Mycena chlorophos]
MLIMPWVDRRHYPQLQYKAPADPPPVLSQEAQALEARIASHQYQPSAKRFPSFCYPDGEWCETSYQKNLFRNVCIFRGIRLLLISRADATNEAKDMIPVCSLAAIHDVREVTPHLVAYVVVQIRLSMSSVPQWMSSESKKFKFNDLYWKVLSAFEDTSDPELPNWRTETLDWLTDHVFGNVPLHDPTSEELDDESDDEAVVQQRQRAAARRVAPTE